MFNQRLVASFDLVLERQGGIYLFRQLSCVLRHFALVTAVEDVTLLHPVFVILRIFTLFAGLRNTVLDGSVWVSPLGR